MGQEYVRALTDAGAVPWIIPLLRDDEETLRLIYDSLDGIFLTGGKDVGPVNYGEQRHRKCGPTDPDRDWTELRLVRWALRDRKPILGVCRGIQVINVAAGGTLFQDIQEQYPSSIKHDYSPPNDGYTRESLVHDARIQPDSQLSRIIGIERVQVNSMHHQAIKTLASGLVASAFAPDESIEGVEAEDKRFVIGVQWHPEELTDTQPGMRRLFRAFTEAARGARFQRA
jgi:putative glutamine amidotransferase